MQKEEDGKNNKNKKFQRFRLEFRRKMIDLTIFFNQSDKKKGEDQSLATIKLQYIST